MDLTKILKEGDKVYSPLFGYGTIDTLNNPASVDYPINITAKMDDLRDSYFNFTKEGHYYNYIGSDCVLFPSKENRDWKYFTRLKTFDKVLVRNNNQPWQAALYSNYSKFDKCHVTTGGNKYTYCVSYNEETKHLLGTLDEWT